jgi:hypothetical protein
VLGWRLTEHVMSIEQSARYVNVGAEVRLTTIAIGPIAGLAGEQAADRASSVKIRIDPEALARIRRGDVEVPRQSTSTAIIRLGCLVGAAPMTEYFVFLSLKTAEFERQHLRLLKSTSQGPDCRRRIADCRSEIYALACERIDSQTTSDVPDKKFGHYYVAGGTLLRAASVSFDGGDEAGLKEAIGKDTVQAYRLAADKHLDLARMVTSWPSWKSVAPALVPPDQRRGDTPEEAKLERKRALQYALAMQNATFANQNLHALGVLRQIDEWAEEAEDNIKKLFSNFELLPTYRFMDNLCEGTDLQLKYKRSLILSYAVADNLKRFKEEVATFTSRFGRDPIEESLAVKGEETCPPLKVDPSVQRLLRK